MKIVVCVKQVPDTTAEKRLTEELYLDRAGCEPIVNPFDEYAVEEALRTRERLGGEVTALCMGPASARETVRRAVAMGADKAVVISDTALARSDAISTAYVLSMALRKLEPDLVLFGMQSTDSSSGLVPGAVAEFLNWPQLTFASKLDLADGKATIRRTTDTGYQLLTARIPAVVSVTKGINEPRYPALKGIMQAKRADIPIWSCADIGADPSKAGAAGAATRVISSSPARARAVGRVVSDDGTAVQQIVDFLIQSKVL